MSEVDQAVAAARASWARISGAEGGPAAGPPRRPGALKARLARIGAAVAAILVAFWVFALVVAPVGIMGALLLIVLLAAAVLGLAVWPSDAAPAPPPPAEALGRLRTVDLKALPAQTGRWLGAQRPLLPAPARGLADRIGGRLDVLSPQLGQLDPGDETALELRRLVGEQLPAFVADYARVPQPLRAVERNGSTPDRQLTDGLALIEREIAAMTERLAQGDLDSLATRGRYLEMKYRGEETG